MIARILIPILLAVLLTDLYIDRRFTRRRCSSRWKRCLWLLPSVAIYILSFLLASEKSFVPADVLYIHLYLLLLGVYLLPRLLFVVCSAVGWGIRVMAGKKDNWGNLVGFAVAVTCFMTTAQGAFCFRRSRRQHAGATSRFDLLYGRHTERASRRVAPCGISPLSPFGQGWCLFGDGQP